MILETPASSAEENMRFDEELLENLGDKTEPILHLYEWKKNSVTFGYFIKPEKLLNLEEVKKRGIDFARRPTGGGVVFHLWDFAFSVLVPARSALFSSDTLKNYNRVNRMVQNVVDELMNQGTHLIPTDMSFQDQNCTQFCMARPTKYDVMFEGRKIAGAAQRKTKNGFLHQGTIALVKPDTALLEAILPSASVREAIVQTTFPLFSDHQMGRNMIRKQLKKHFANL